MMGRIGAALCVWLLWAGAAQAAGFSRFTAPDPDGKPLPVLVWYPSDAPTTEQQLGLLEQTVAPEGPIAPGRHPLVVISHGTGGSAMRQSCASCRAPTISRSLRPTTELARRVPEICADPPGFDRAAFHAAFDAKVVRFFEAPLQPSAR